MALRAALPLLLVLIALWAPAAAATRVPDPTWLGGLFDGGDGDELVALVWDQTPAVEPLLEAVPAPAPGPAPAIALPTVAGGHDAVPEGSRSPPPA